VIKKDYQILNFSSEDLAGEVNEVPESTNSGEKYRFDFRVNLGPCESEGGCYAADFRFEFIPSVGISKIEVDGDNPVFGGQFSQQYMLVKSAESSDLAYDLLSQENQLPYFACNAPDEGELTRSALGEMINWFNILLLFVVLLRAIRTRSYA
jgi:hypothetical protein